MSPAELALVTILNWAYDIVRSLTLTQWLLLLVIGWLAEISRGIKTLLREDQS